MPDDSYFSRSNSFKDFKLWVGFNQMIIDSFLFVNVYFDKIFTHTTTVFDKITHSKSDRYFFIFRLDRYILKVFMYALL